MKGECVWFHSGKGFGFVKDEESGDEYFCHWSAIQYEGYKQLKQGQKILFEIEVGPKGKTQACNVRVIE